MVLKKPREEDRKRSRRNYIVVKQTCNICHGRHAVRSCERSNSMSVDDRWKNAKGKNLCFRCLADNRQGKGCWRAKEWGEESIRKKVKTVEQLSSRNPRILIPLEILMCLSLEPLQVCLARRLF